MVDEFGIISTLEESFNNDYRNIVAIFTQTILKELRIQFVYDLIYSPSKTQLLMSAETKGAKIINGLDMLAYQGAESFSLWEKVDPPYEIMSQELRYGK